MRQGSPLSPFLLVTVLDGVIKKCLSKWHSQKMGLKLGEHYFSLLAFADDILIFSHKPSELTRMALDLSDALAEIGLTINWGKCSWTCNTDEELSLAVQGNTLPYIPAHAGFPYLGTLLTFDGRSGTTLDHRMSSAWRAFYSRSDIWSSKSSLHSKLHVFRMTVEPCALFGCGSWHLIRQERNTLDTTLRRIEEAGCLLC